MKHLVFRLQQISSFRFAAGYQTYKSEDEDELWEKYSKMKGKVFEFVLET